MPNNIGITQLVSGTFDGVTRTFAFVLEDNMTHNALYEITLDDRDDVTDWTIDDGTSSLDTSQPISQRVEWEFVSRAFDFKQGSTPFTELNLYDADLWLKDIIE
jgi:hypothetical protein